MDAEELDCAMTALGFHHKTNFAGSFIDRATRMSAREGKPVIAKVERQEISLDVFTMLMKGELTGRDPLEELRCVYAALARPCAPGDDSAPPGQISKARLRHVCKEFDVGLTEDELELMVSALDTDHGGTVDEEEFLAVMKHSAWF